MNLKMLLFASVSLVLFASCHNSDDPYMTLATKTLDVEAEGGLFTVDLSSNVYYRVNNDCQTDGSDSHWAVVDSHETQGEITKFTIKVSENSSTSSRVGAIRFIGDDVTPLKLVITQKMIVPKGISPTTESIDATITESSFKVFGDKEWKAVCTDADVTVSPIIIRYGLQGFQFSFHCFLIPHTKVPAPTRKTCSLPSRLFVRDRT